MRQETDSNGRPPGGLEASVSAKNKQRFLASWSNCVSWFLLCPRSCTKPLSVCEVWQHCRQAHQVTDVHRECAQRADRGRKLGRGVVRNRWGAHRNPWLRPQEGMLTVISYRQLTHWLILCLWFSITSSTCNFLEVRSLFYLHLLKKRTWCWERLKAGGEGDDRGWDGWMVSPTQWTWIWANSGRW